jgi:hypothetical protein
VSAVVSATLLSSTLVSAAGTNVLRPGRVAGIVKHDFQVNNVDNANLSYALQTSHEQGSALAMDDAMFRADKLSGLATIDGPRYYPFFGTVISSAVPKQTSYPAQFAVVTSVHSSPGTPKANQICSGSGDALAFQRNSSSSPWRVSIEPYLPLLRDVPKFKTTSKGYVAPLASKALKTSVAGLPALYVDALNAQAPTGRAGPLLPAGDFAYGKCHDLGLIDPHQNSVIVRGLQFSFHASTLNPSDLIAFATRGGGALAMFTLQERISEAPTVANRYVIWSHGKTPWWSLLPAGDYSRVSWTVDQELAVAVPSKGSRVSPRVVGAYSEVLSVVGTAVG